MAKVDDEVMRNRQTWFWRRTTLQATIFVISMALFYSLADSGTRVGDWPTTVMQLACVGAVTWLVTMYFAMVDNSDKLGAVLPEVLKAVADIRNG